MARITVEDCLGKVANPFELVILAARRAYDISHGAEPLVPRDRDKNTVLALREIASGAITQEALRERVVEEILSPTARPLLPEEAAIEALPPVVAMSEEDERGETGTEDDA